MIFYTEQTTQILDIHKPVERDSAGNLVLHSSGEVLGVVMSSNQVSDTDPAIFESKIYVAGGGGQSLILGASWDGQLTRFEFQNGQAVPVASGGHGWLIPEFPQSMKSVSDIVQGAIYK